MRDKSDFEKLREIKEWPPAKVARSAFSSEDMKHFEWVMVEHKWTEKEKEEINKHGR